jgi:membrane protease YdiL (CAAX protease family)
MAHDMRDSVAGFVNEPANGFAVPPPPRALVAKPPPAPVPPPVAHWAHTLALFGVLLLTTFLGHSRGAALATVDTPHIPRYITSITLEILLLGSVIAGIYHRGAFFAQAWRSRRYNGWTNVGLGLALYLAGNVAIIAVSLALYKTPLQHQRNTDVVMALLPHTVNQFLLWFCVSLSAGVCEEFIFRGYLLQQLTAWFRRPVLAIVVAGLLFGCVHLYEGLGAILPLAALGIVYGFAARWLKGDLRPGAELRQDPRTGGRSRRAVQPPQWPVPGA